MLRKKWQISFFVLMVFVSVGLNAEAPKSIKDQYIVFVIEKDDQAKQGKAYLNDVYHFRKGGTYDSYYDGKRMSSGDYTYRVLKNKDRAHLLLTFSRKDGSTIYQMDLHFNSTTTGHWRWLQRDDPTVSRFQSGTFHLVSEKEALEIIHSAD